MIDSCFLKEDELYWRQLVGAISKPTARALLDKLDLSYPLGAKPPSGKAKRPQLYEYFLATKKSHPRKVLLVRVGLSHSCKLLISILYCYTWYCHQEKTPSTSLYTFSHADW